MERELWVMGGACHQLIACWLENCMIFRVGYFLKVVDSEKYRLSNPGHRATGIIGWAFFSSCLLLYLNCRPLYPIYMFANLICTSAYLICMAANLNCKPRYPICTPANLIYTSAYLNSMPANLNCMHGNLNCSPAFLNYRLFFKYRGVFNMIRCWIWRL